MNEMDEMELDRYITAIMDSEHRDLKRDVSAKQQPIPQQPSGKEDEKNE